MEDNKIAFLDTEVNVLEDGTVKFKIYRKPTHTDQYLNFTSNHHIKQKLGIVNTFNHRTTTIVSNEADRKEEEERIKMNLRNCDFPEWALQKKKKNNKEKVKEEKRPLVVIPYISKLSEKVAKIYRKYGIDTIHKPTSTIKNNLCKLKDSVHRLERPGANYKISCKKHVKDNYIGETDRAMKFRGYEHGFIEHSQLKTNLTLKKEIEITEEEPQDGLRRSSRLQTKERVDYKKMDQGENILSLDKQISSEVAEHMANSPHVKEDIECVILGYEENWWKRGVKEAIDIKRYKPTMNKDAGRYHLPAIWNQVIRKDQRKKSKDPIGGKTDRNAGRILNFNTIEEDQPSGGRN